MTTASNIPSPSLPVIGADGRISQVWFQFFLTLFRRTGDALGATPDDQTLAPGGDADLGDLLGQLYGLRDSVHMVPPAAHVAPSDDQVPPVGHVLAPDDQAPPLPASTAPDDPHARIEALEAALQRVQNEIEAIRQGQQL